MADSRMDQSSEAGKNLITVCMSYSVLRRILRRPTSAGALSSGLQPERLHQSSLHVSHNRQKHHVVCITMHAYNTKLKVCRTVTSIFASRIQFL